MSLSIKDLQYAINDHLDNCVSLDKDNKPVKAEAYAQLIQHLKDKLHEEVEYLEEVVDLHDCKLELKGYCECVGLIRRIKVIYGSLK